MPIDAATIADQLLLGRYRVLEERGKGGFGTVCVCWDPRLMRRVAIKTIPLHAAEPVVKPARRRDAEPAEEELRRQNLLQAALAETRTASMLAHPNIVSMLDFESDDENAYIIMEYVDGASLAELLDSSEDGAILTADEAAAVVEDACDALQFAHDNGVLHLDIKPDNILIDHSGRVKIADFGMAALSSATGFAGARGGTCGYMPPEQIEGSAVDVRTDVFAMACVMYEALTGFRPFAAKSPNQSLELVERGAADPCALSETISCEAADALLVALDPDPEVRPSSAQALAEELLVGLGKPKAGHRSLAGFVDEVLDDSEPAAEKPMEDQPDAPAPARLAAAFSDPDLGVLSAGAPRFLPQALRFLGAVASGLVAGFSAGALLPGDALSALVAGFVAGGLGVAVPQLGYALAIVALACASFASGAWVHGAAVAVAGAAWWLVYARKAPRANAPALAGCLSFGGALPFSPMVLGYLVGPSAAALGSTVGFVCLAALACLAGVGDVAAFSLVDLARPTGFASGAAALEQATSPTFWLLAISWPACAAATSALCGNAPRWRCYLGGLAGGVVCALFCAAVAGMENGGSWSEAASQVAVTGLGSTILVALCVFLFGAPRALDLDARRATSDRQPMEAGA